MSKQPICDICGTPFVKYRSTQKVCGPSCAMVYAEQKAKEKADKEWRKETKRLKEKVKTRREWLKDAQTAFNEYVRVRDEHLPCISCNRHHRGQYHAGHYLSVGSTPELRFHPFNNNKQCAPCNNHLSGNAVKYRIGLISRIGTNAVAWLEGPHIAQKWTIEDLKDIRDYYKELTRELRKTAVQTETD